MDSQINTSDWTLIQSFLAVAETGSLSAAAARLDRSQPTIGRHVKTLEREYGAQIFERHARGLRLSETGLHILPMARRINESMNALSLAAAGHATRLEGTVRITASVFAAHFVLPPLLARIRAEEPAIDIVLIPTDRAENLLFRAADIALRMYRPTQLDIVARHLGQFEMGIFAAKSYLERAGRPQRAEDLFDFDLIGFEQNDLILRTMRQMGWNVSPDAFSVRCDNQSAYWELVRSGCGIGFSQRIVGCADPLVEELDFGIKIPPLDVWLAAHQGMRETPRIRRVWDMMADGLRRIMASESTDT
jgi:DNA-binding transcriptional LysR family regulator